MNAPGFASLGVPTVVVMVPQNGEKRGETGVLEGNQGRSVRGTTRGEVAVPAGDAGDVLRVRGGQKHAEKGAIGRWGSNSAKIFQIITKNYIGFGGLRRRF